MQRDPCAGRGHPAAAQSQAAVRDRARPGWWRQESVLDRRHVCYEVAIEAVQERAHHFLDQRIRQVEREVDRRHEDDRTHAVVRRHRPLVGIGEGGDLARLGEPAAPPHVEHHIVDGLCLEEPAKCGARTQRFATDDWETGRLREAADAGRIVHADRILDPERIDRTQRVADPDRGRQAPERMHFAHDLHPVAHCPADLLERYEPLIDISRREIRIAAGRREAVEWPDLHCRVAFAQQVIRKFAGMMVPRREVIVAVARLCGLVALELAAPRRIGVVIVAGTGVVDTHPVVAAATQRLPHRHCIALAVHVP